MTGTEQYLQYPTDDRIGTVVNNRFVHESRSCEEILCRRSPILPFRYRNPRFLWDKNLLLPVSDAILKDSGNSWAKIRSAKFQMDSNECAYHEWMRERERERVEKEWSCSLQRAGRELISPFRPGKLSGVRFDEKPRCLWLQVFWVSFTRFSARGQISVCFFPSQISSLSNFLWLFLLLLRADYFVVLLLEQIRRVRERAHAV